MHVVIFLKSNQLPLMEDLIFSKKTDFGWLDFNLCRRRFLRKCTAEFNDTWHGRANFSKNTDFGTSDFQLCGRRFLKNCMTEFNETRHNNYILKMLLMHVDAFF